jgi:hypothetical protein
LQEFKIPKRKELPTQSADETKKWEISISLSQERVKICRFFIGIQATYSYILHYFAYVAYLEMKRVLEHKGKFVGSSMEFKNHTRIYSPLFCMLLTLS